MQASSWGWRMHGERQFWLFTMSRGLLALIVGSGILALPQLARTLLLLPFAVTVSLILFAAYGIADGALVLASSFATHLSSLKWTTRIQGLAGLVMGCTLLTILLDRAKLPWFLSLAAAQALFTSATEYVVGRHASSDRRQVWDYAASAIAGTFAMCYAYARMRLSNRLTYEELLLLIYAFLVAFGAAQCVNATRVLYACHTARRHLAAAS